MCDCGTCERDWSANGTLNRCGDVSGLAVAILFEGRDAAGKGGVIKRIVEHLNPRCAKIVALAAPSDREKKASRLPPTLQNTHTDCDKCAVVVFPTLCTALAGQGRDCHL